jgi:glycosyltransferase involved in cell wall biosynthesis
MSLCDFDDSLRCIYCGYQARKPRTKRQCQAPQEQRRAQLTQYASAVARWLRAGRPTRSDSETDRLFAICQQCERYDAERGACKLCGCRVSSSKWPLLNKIRMATENCPIDKWAAETIDKPATMRIGIVTPNLLVGGVESWIASLAREWSRSGRAEAIVAHTGTAASADPVLVERLGRWATIVSSAEIPGVVRVQSPRLAVATVAQAVDRVIAWSVPPDLLQACSGTPTVGVSHGCFDWWMAAADPLVAGWVAVHNVAASCCPRKPAVIENGVDIERCQSTLTRMQARERLGLSPLGWIVGYVGRFSGEKRVRSIAQAAELLPNGWRLVLVGRGADIPPPSDRVTILPPVEHVGDVWRACDVAVVASDAEGYCLAAVEALAAGKPLASTRVGVVETMPAGVSIIPQPAEPEAIAAAILDAHRRGLPDGLRQWALSQSAARMAASWLDYLSQDVD